MPLPAPASEFYRAQQRLILATLNLTRSKWRRMSLDNIDGSWGPIAPALLEIVTAAQLGAARNGSSYVGPTLDSLDQSTKPDALVRPQGFSGVASDGRPLDSLLLGAKAYAKTAQSLDVGGRWLDMVVHSQVQDAGRMAASVDTFTRPRVGWVRAVNPPCCQRCAVLAGKWFRSNQGFQRHPRCDCFHVPSREADPAHPGVFIGPEDVKDLTGAQRKAIADGADMNRVINAHRGRSVRSMTTTELAKRGQVRLTPEAIYRVSATRDEALRRLRDNGYVL